MKVYLDVFFVINAFMNFIVFLIENMLQRRVVNVVRILIASCVGAGFAILLLVGGIHERFYLFFVFYLMGSGVIVRLAFGKTTIGAWIRNVIIFYVVSCLLAGAITQLQSMMGGSLPFIVLLLAVSILLLAIQHFLMAGRQYMKKIHTYYKVCFEYKGNRFRGNGLVDTGNQLREPSTKNPVAVCEKRLFGKMLAQKDRMDIRYIPFHSLGKECGLIPAVQVDAMDLAADDGTKIHLNKPWIAIFDSYVSSEGEYQLLLHPDMIKNIKQEE